MESPFPGMDPFLEGNLWPDVHNSLAYLIKIQLAPRLSESYTVHINKYTVEDTSPEEDIGIMYPDTAVFRKAEDPSSSYGNYTPVTMTLPAIRPVSVNIPVVEIKDRTDNKLVTAIEIISPVNKRKPGLEQYREKREGLHEAGVHLIEIDLIRRGERPMVHPFLPKAHYLISLIRAQDGRADIWAVSIKDTLPVIPVPLKHPDKDVWLDLQTAMKDLYVQGYFRKSIDYSEDAPPPAFLEEEIKWIGKVTGHSG